ncbi:MAG: thiamine phosphate synthase [Nitrospirae bacterium]|nr:thiamine phosphate synthase [Nitrospirota bacterium]
MDFNLYLISDRKLIADSYSLIAAVRQALKGGVKVVQLREKDLEMRELLKLAYRMRELTMKYEARLFINDRLDIALAVGADGVHLTQNSIPAYAVRKVVKKRLMIGVSTHSLKEAKEAEQGGADFVTFGPLYKTSSKLKYGTPLGLSRLKNVCKEMSIPVLALGGVKSENIDEVKKSGAYGAAMISEILCADDIKEKTRELINILGE